LEEELEKDKNLNLKYLRVIVRNSMKNLRNSKVGNLGFQGSTCRDQGDLCLIQVTQLESESHPIQLEDILVKSNMNFL
ncbi:hypothetical protein PJP07_31315, partial [Mycobacterium kansasii]